MADSKVLGAGEITLVSDLKATDRLKYNTEITCLTSGDHTFWASQGKDNEFCAIEQGLSIDMGKPLLYIDSSIASNAQVNDAWVMYPKAQFPKKLNDLDLSQASSSDLTSRLGNKKLYITGTISNGLFTVLETDNDEVPEYYWFPVQSEDSSYPYGVGFPEHGTERDIKSYIIHSDSELSSELPRWKHFLENDNSTYPVPETNEYIYLCAIYNSDNASSYNYISDDSSLDKVHNGIYYSTATESGNAIESMILDANGDSRFIFPDHENSLTWHFEEKNPVEEEIGIIQWTHNTKRPYNKIEHYIYYYDQEPIEPAGLKFERRQILPFSQIQSKNILLETSVIQNSIWTINPNSENFQYLLIGTINPDGQYVALDKDNYYFKLSYEENDEYTSENDEYTSEIDRYSKKLIELMSYTYDEMGNNYLTLSEQQEVMTDTINNNMITVNNMISEAETLISDLNTQMNSEVSSINLSIESLRLDLSSELDIDIKGPLNELSSSINTYFKFNSDGLIIGKDGSPIFLKIEPEVITFLNNNNVPMAWFSNDTLTVNDVVGQNSLQIGQFGFYEDEHHNVHLNWLGNTN